MQTRNCRNEPILKRSVIALAFALSANTPWASAGTGWVDALDANPALTLGEVVVRAVADGPLPTRSILTSVDVLGSDLVKSQNVSNSWKLYSQLPGVQLTEFGQGTTSGKLSLRGFNGEGEINAVKFLIDGIPSNSNDGNMPYIDMVFPLDIESIEVVRGTNDPRYGLHNIAGNTNINTRIGGNDGQARVAYGSFNTREIQAVKAIEKNGFSQNYFIAKQVLDGYRSHANSDRTSVSGKWFYTPEAGNYRAGVILRHYDGRADEAGYLTLAQSRATPQMSPAHNSTDLDERTLDQLSGHYDNALNDRLFWSTKVYANKIDDRRWVRFSAGVSQQERFVGETHYGLLSNLTHRPEVSWAKSVAVEGGIEAQQQKNHSDRYNTTNRIRTAQTRNQEFDFDTYGAYLQAVIQLDDRWRIVPAYRADVIRGGYTNRLNGLSYAVNDYGTIGQPKISVVFAPANTYSVYGNWGRTFQVGVGTASYKVGQAVDLQPSINNGWEMGVKLTPTENIEGRVALWQQVASNEARRKLNDPSNASENIGRTRRNGIDIQASVKTAEQLRFWGGMAIQEARILLADAATPLSQGKEIDHVPRRLLSVGADYQINQGAKLTVSVNHQGDYYTERTNLLAPKYGGYTLVNVSSSYRLKPGIMLDLQVRNLTDRYFEYVWHDGTQTLHAPGDGRAVYGSVNFQF